MLNYCGECGKAYKTYPSWKRSAGGGRFCSRQCLHKCQLHSKALVEDGKRTRRAATTSPSAFWARTKRVCDWLEWQGSRYPAGYGHYGRGYAHRRAWEICFGPIPPGRIVCHRCDNPPCVNPAHLFIGTHKDNTQDAIEKGRFKPWEYPHSHENLPRGEGHPHAKLTNAKVVEILALLRAGNSARSICPRFGVSIQTIWCISSGKTWRHIARA